MASRSKCILRDRKTIEDVARFLGVSPKNKIKTLAMMITEEDAKAGKTRSAAVVLLMRGDHQMNEAKLSIGDCGQRGASHAGRGDSRIVPLARRIPRSARHRLGQRQ